MDSPEDQLSQDLEAIHNKSRRKDNIDLIKGQDPKANRLETIFSGGQNIEIGSTVSEEDLIKLDEKVLRINSIVFQEGEHSENGSYQNVPQSMLDRNGVRIFIFTGNDPEIEKFRIYADDKKRKTITTFSIYNEGTYSLDIEYHWNEELNKQRYSRIEEWNFVPLEKMTDVHYRIANAYMQQFLAPPQNTE